MTSHTLKPKDEKRCLDDKLTKPSTTIQISEKRQRFADTTLFPIVKLKAPI